MSSEIFEYMASLYREASKEEDWLLSPMSIFMAMLMVMDGAREETRTEIMKTLGFESNAHVYDEIKQEFSEACKKGTLVSANLICMNDKFKIKEEYLNKEKEHHDTTVKSMDFSKPQDVAAEINQFVTHQTRQLIRDIIKVNDITGTEALFLLNAIYFKANWSTPFNKDLTFTNTFYPVKGDTSFQTIYMTTVDTHLYSSYNRQSELNKCAEGVSLEFENGMRMVVVVPREDKSLGALNALLRGAKGVEYLRYLCSNSTYSKTEVSITIPKFELEHSSDLKEILHKMGIKLAFTQMANLTGMCDSALHVSKVAHKAIMKVDEEGVEAAAVTQCHIAPACCGAPPKRLYIDRPFLVMIVTKQDNIPVFMGNVVRPKNASA
ncbi:hypothetical protein Ciccas_011156 [Cichlidogyrus casuarinus]|uniref:Serpin domain-containing protein n=1 Tax=Cichlidogyrus casuarinus TaxID=1844966 RepID=A0ABD2PS39_9PLAT